MHLCTKFGEDVSVRSWVMRDLPSGQTDKPSDQYSCILASNNHDDVIKWKTFPRYWPFVRGIHRTPVIPHTKANDAELWCFLWFALNIRLSKQWWGWWFETPSCPLWRHCNAPNACVGNDRWNNKTTALWNVWPWHDVIMNWWCLRRYVIKKEVSLSKVNSISFIWSIYCQLPLSQYHKHLTQPAWLSWL